MKRYMCSVCGYVYDEESGCPDQGVATDVEWENLPDDFICPECGAETEMFDIL
jgi:rubredoxin